MTVQTPDDFDLRPGGETSIAAGGAVTSRQLQTATENATWAYGAGCRRTLFQWADPEHPFSTQETAHDFSDTLLAVVPFVFGIYRNLEGARIHYEAEDVQIVFRWYSTAGVLQTTSTINVSGAVIDSANGGAVAAVEGYVEISVITNDSIGYISRLWAEEKPLTLGNFP